MSKKITDQDKTIFQHAMRDVRPLNSDNKPKNTVHSKKPKPFVTLTQQPVFDDEPILISHASRQNIQADTYLSYFKPGIDNKLMRNIKRGENPIEARLDLHGLTAEQAESLLRQFLNRCQDQGKRNLLIIHGKSRGKAPVIKNLLDQWLRQIPYVIAFCSTQPKHGGTGSVYVRLAMGCF